MCSSRDGPTPAELAEQQAALDQAEELAPEISREGTPSLDTRDTTFDYQQEAKLKSVSLRVG